MNASKPRTQPHRKRLPEQPGPSSFLQQGSLASFIQRCAVPKKPNAPRKSLQGRTRSAAEHSSLRNSADPGVRMQRNSSCAELYTSVQEQPSRPETRLEEEKYRTAEAINKALTDQLESLPRSDAQKRLAAASDAFESVIAAIPAYALVLKRIKKSYEECWGVRGKQEDSRQELEAMQDMLELQQAEKQTLLATVMQLRKEVTALSGRVMEKTTKIAALERKLLDFARSPDADDPADCETQKGKGSAFAALTSPKQGNYDCGKNFGQRVKAPSKPSDDFLPLLLSAEQTPTVQR